MPMTMAELLALPEDDRARWLVRGELREKPRRFRDRDHSRVTARLAQLLGNWLDRQPTPRGELLGGNAACRLARDPDTVVGIDLLYLAPEALTGCSGSTAIVDGVPTLVIDVLSPNDTFGDIDERIDTYEAARVPLVWVVHPRFRTVTVHQPAVPPRMFNLK
jgi:Uma2 family endonuclease